MKTTDSRAPIASETVVVELVNGRRYFLPRDVVLKLFLTSPLRASLLIASVRALENLEPLGTLN